MSEDQEFNNPTVLHDAQGNVIKVGSDPDDPMILGADSYVAPFRVRDADSYPGYPRELFDIEQDWFLPVAQAVAEACEVDLLDERTYKKLVGPFRQTRLCVVFSLQDVQLHAGFATWDGLIVYARDYPIVKVTLHAHLATKRCGITMIQVWQKSSQSYLTIGNAIIGGDVMDRNTAYDVVTNYLEREVFSVKSNLKPGEI